MAKRAGLWLVAVAIFLSSSMNILLSSNAFGVDTKTMTYKKVGKISNCPVTQGGTTDGTHAYFACFGDEYKNAELVKMSLSGEEVMRKAISPKDVGHANDMTYNSKLKKIVLSKVDEDKYKGQLVLIDPETLEIVGTKQADTDSSWSALCYHAAKDEYISNGKVFDSEFKYTRKAVYSNDAVDKLVGGGSMTYQGMACDESYIYLMRGGLGGGENGYSGKFKIVVYDWSGDVKAIYSVFVDKHTENENIFIANGKMYVGLNMVSGGSKGEQFGVIEGAIAGRGEVGSGSGTHALTIGSYNLHGTPLDGEDGCKVKSRFETAAKNITSMGMDIVGMQEYSDYDDSKSPDCDGKQVKLLDILNAANGGIWKATKLPAGSDGGGYQETQASILYNSVVTSLASDDAKNIEGGAIKDDSWKSGSNGGGSPIFHIAGFSDASGNTFYVANGHWATSNSDQRKKDTEAIVEIMGEYSGAKFIVGDTNSEIGQEVEKVMSKASYDDAHLTAATKNAADYGTMAGNGKGNNIIDRIYYEQATVSSPSSYTTLNCKKATDCGSDHRPISAVFPSVMVGSSESSDCGGNQKQVFDSGIPNYNVNTCSCSAATSGDSTISGDTLAEQAFTFLISTPVASNDNKPLNAAQAAGIIGNLMIETGGGTYELDPEAVNSIGASGIVQWLGGRKTALEKFAESKGTDWKDFKVQLQFVVQELETGYKKAVMEGKSSSSKTIDKGLKNITDVSEQGAKDAADIVARYYEIPSISDAYPNRQTAAAKAFNDFKDSAPGASSAVGASGNCSNGESSGENVTSIGDIAFPLAIKYGDITTSGSAWTHTYHEDTCTYYYALDIVITKTDGNQLAKTVPVIAMHDGDVISASLNSIKGYGNTVIIHGSDGLNYAALHIAEMKVSKGQAVKKGDTIGIGVVNANVYHVHVDLSNGASRPSACASCSPKICPAQGRFLPELRPKLQEIYESMKGGAS